MVLQKSSLDRIARNLSKSKFELGAVAIQFCYIFINLTVYFCFVSDLSKNRFSELPDEVTTFPFLERLHVYHNVIRSIPETISGLQCLSHLDLSRNQLVSLPREICHLPIQVESFVFVFCRSLAFQNEHFQVLIIANNRLTSLPDELGRMPCLTELDASCNQLTHLPPHLSDLQHLRSFLLRSNLLLCLPVDVTYLTLVRLDLRANRIASLPVELRLMKSLIDLLVDDNPLTSPPASVSDTIYFLQLSTFLFNCFNHSPPFSVNCFYLNRRDISSGKLNSDTRIEFFFLFFFYKYILHLTAIIIFGKLRNII